jgi:large subunit ribosomal protein L4
MPEIPLYNMEGKKTGTLPISEEIFDATINESVMHQALIRQLANMRRGTHSTKTRGEVAGGGRKPWRQKGTGRARHGSIRSPLWRGGGITFGPKPRDYSQAMPKNMRRLALCGALTTKVMNQKMIALEDLKFEAPKTKQFVEMMEKLEMPQSVLFLIDDKNRAIEKSASNIQGVKVITLDTINIYDILKYDKLVATKDAIQHLEEVLIYA